MRLSVLHKTRSLNTAAFNTQFLQYKKQLYVYVLGMVKQDDVAKDVIQELYLRLYSNRTRIKYENARFYFFRSAKNGCIDWFRKNSEQKGVEFSFEHERTAEDNGERKELQHHFRKLIETLPPKCREVIYLKDVCAFETHEIVEITGLTANNIRVLLSRARAMVKEGLAKIYNYEAIRKS